MARKALIVLLVFLAAAGSAQLSTLSRYEKCWALFHPSAALKVKKISKRCYPLYYQADVKQQLDTFSSGGNLDAFRHVFFMAAYAQRIKTKKLRKLGIAHEKGNYRQFLRSGSEEGEIPDSLSSAMDLRNNETGLGLGCANKKISLGELKQLAIAKVKNGQALILKRNKTGHYVTCENEVIDRREFTTWYVPKCLIASGK